MVLDLKKINNPRYLIGVAVSLAPDQVSSNAIKILGMNASLASNPEQVADFITSRYNAGNSALVQRVFAGITIPKPANSVSGREFGDTYVGQLLPGVLTALAGTAGAAIFGGLALNEGAGNNQNEGGGSLPPTYPFWDKIQLFGLKNKTWGFIALGITAVSTIAYFLFRKKK